MTKADVIESIGKLFAEPFAELGFVQRAETNFSRQKSGAEHRIGFNVLEQDRDRVFRMVGGVGVRLEAIERIVTPDGELGSIATIGMPLHLLRADQEYRPWAFADRHALEALRPAIMDEVRRYAVPFFDRFGDYATVVAALRSDSPKDWFMAASDFRDALLVADAFLNLGQAEARKLGEELLKKYEGRMPKYSQALRSHVERVRM